MKTGKRIECKRNEGFTLVELLICIAILGVIAVIIQRCIFSSAVMYDSSKKEVKLEIELQLAVDAIGDEIMECSSIEKITEEGDIRYLLRKSLAKAVLVIYDPLTSQLSMRNIILSEELLNPDVDEEEQYNTLMRTRTGTDQDDSKTELSDKVTAFSIDPLKVGGSVSDKIYELAIQMQWGETGVSCTKQLGLRN